MAHRRQRQTSRKRFTLGGVAAELDPLLESSFYETTQFSTLMDPKDTRCYLIGRTGSGKTALLSHIKAVKPKNVIIIKPENLSLPYICNSGAVRTLRENNINLTPLFISLWKHIFIVEIIRHRYGIKTPAARQHYFNSLMDKISQDTSKVAALEYFRDFQHSFWCPTDERVRELTDSITANVKAQGDLGPPQTGLKLTLGAEDGRAHQQRSELIERYQTYVNRSQLPRLNQMVDVLDDEILDDPARFTWIVIDDLDREWVDEELANELIMCLFQSVLELNHVKNLKVIVALRDNIFRELDFTGRRGAQEEKYRSQTMHLRWNKHDLVGMLDERVLSGAEIAEIPNIDTIAQILPNKNAKRKDALDFVLHRTMKRPRDAIAFLTACLERGDGSASITWETIEAAEFAYSEDRLLALRDEWKSSYPGIDSVFQQFAQCRTIMSPSDFLQQLDNVASLLALAEFDNSWLMEMLQPAWEGGDVSLNDYRPLIELLYHMGFIGARLITNQPLFETDYPDFFRRGDPLPQIQGFVVHPMFWAALGITRREMFDN